jgi:hypothetical protein
VLPGAVKSGLEVDVLAIAPMVNIAEKIRQRVGVIRASSALKMPERSGSPFGAIKICRHCDFR